MEHVRFSCCMALDPAVLIFSCRMRRVEAGDIGRNVFTMLDIVLHQIFVLTT